MQSVAHSQHPVARWLSENRDGICQIPLGAAWFDLFPWQETLTPNALTLAVYPTESLLKNHALRLKLMGYTDDDFEVLTSDIPPHAERYLWERLAQGRTPLLLMTARKLQSIHTLSQLIRHPNLGPILIQQAHQVISHLWGPFSNPYMRLCDFFREQWQSHPALILFTNPMSQAHVSQLADYFALEKPLCHNAPLPLETSRLYVSRYITQHQKLKALRETLFMPQPGKTLIVCHSPKAARTLEKYLHPLKPVVLHHQLDYAEREIRLLALLHEDESIILVESTMLAEVPTHLFYPDQLRMIHWQMPWSPEAMAQQVLPATRYADTTVETAILYTKEDFTLQKQWLKNHFSQDPAYRSSTVDHLTRLRLGLRATDTCRILQLKSFLGQDHSDPIPCKSCDVCLAEAPSSRWMNLAAGFLY